MVDVYRESVYPSPRLQDIRGRLSCDCTSASICVQETVEIEFSLLSLVGEDRFDHGSGCGITGKFLKGENGSGDHVPQCVNEQIRPLAAIESESHFFEVGRKMLCADMVPSSANATFEQGECVFYGVRVDVSHDIDFFLVIDSLVFFGWHSRPLDCGRVGRVIIGKDHIHILADVLPDVFGECLSLHIFGMEQSEFPVALPNADYNFFILQATVPAASLIYPANEGLIYFDFSVKHRLVQFGHCRTNPVAEIPSSFVADSDSSLNLAGRHSLFRLTEQVRSREPLFQRQVCIIEDCASEHRELVAA